MDCIELEELAHLHLVVGLSGLAWLRRSEKAADAICVEVSASLVPLLFLVIVKADIVHAVGKMDDVIGGAESSLVGVKGSRSGISLQGALDPLGVQFANGGGDGMDVNEQDVVDGACVGHGSTSFFATMKWVQRIYYYTPIILLCQLHYFLMRIRRVTRGISNTTVLPAVVVARSRRGGGAPVVMRSMLKHSSISSSAVNAER